MDERESRDGVVDRGGGGLHPCALCVRLQPTEQLLWGSAF